MRQTVCSDTFTLEAQDPSSGKHGNATSRVRFIGQTVELNVLMLGRGTIHGRVTYEDGTTTLTAVDGAARCQVRANVVTDVVVDLLGYYL